MESILSNEKECYICHKTQALHKHHIFFGTANRKVSEQYGCWCWLCYEHHNGSARGVHFNIALDRKLKQEAQRKFEEIYGSDEYRRAIGRSYL